MLKLGFQIARKYKTYGFQLLEINFEDDISSCATQQNTSGKGRDQNTYAKIRIPMKDWNKGLDSSHFTTKKCIQFQYFIGNLILEHSF